MQKLFIHIPKNAGMTIRGSEVFKDKILPVQRKWIENFKDFNNTMKEYGERDVKGVEHARWRDVSRNITDQYKAFAVVRNPWSKVVSHYLFAKEAVQRGNIDSSYADTRSLEHFLDERNKWYDKKYTWYRAIRGWHPQLHHVTDLEGNVRCDILRVEHLKEDVLKYFNMAEMPRSRNVTSIKEDYRTLYNSRTIQLIAKWYQKDIDYWDFDFDTGARKNIWAGKTTN
jgi:hypothetical protein